MLTIRFLAAVNSLPSNRFSVEEIETALLDCLKDQDKGLAHRECTSESKAINQISRLAEGDLRKAYNILEVIVEGLSNENAVSEDAVALFAKERSIRYDRDEDEHYDTVSALIKSMWERS